MFAQRVLAVTFDLGTAFASDFDAPSCVVQELALKPLLDEVVRMRPMPTKRVGLALEAGIL
ncbi:hypothetical protein CVS27_09165 [Arthrobacter glacialis]|uniref:Uncharacterized protein n=1 Tax=Arthrobacter glacialis TaxID=1664 RepID=A0A2S3ZWG4_ARTGL|nr:hypothetical protein CVS27_09165 [Arthrobacter glacialis]